MTDTPSIGTPGEPPSDLPPEQQPAKVKSQGHWYTLSPKNEARAKLISAVAGLTIVPVVGWIAAGVIAKKSDWFERQYKIANGQPEKMEAPEKPVAVEGAASKQKKYPMTKILSPLREELYGGNFIENFVVRQESGTSYNYDPIDPCFIYDGDKKLGRLKNIDLKNQALNVTSDIPLPNGRIETARSINLQNNKDKAFVVEYESRTWLNGAEAVARLDDMEEQLPIEDMYKGVQIEHSQKFLSDDNHYDIFKFTYTYDSKAKDPAKPFRKVVTQTSQAEQLTSTTYVSKEEMFKSIKSENLPIKLLPATPRV